MDAKEQLRRQLLFIELSCRGYDSGIHEESLRIAVALRVLFHHTPKSHSLIEQLGVRSSLQLLSTFRERESDETERGLVISFGGILSYLGVTPELGSSPHRRSLPLADWWSEIVHTFNGHFSRRDVILNAANQDGGAHVAPNPSHAITELRTGVGTLRVTTDEGTTVQNLNNSHYHLLRQFGYEVLNSPDFLAIDRNAQPCATAPPK